MITQIARPGARRLDHSPKARPEEFSQDAITKKLKRLNLAVLIVSLALGLFTLSLHS